MLSIIIPTYNYSAYELALEINLQCEKALIEYEILVLDDASQNILFRAKNERINMLPNAKFEINLENLGRAGNINKLIQNAKYDWILLLDCDVKPVRNDFIQKYLNSIRNGDKITFGGIAYKNEKPTNEELLRWVYGKKREEISPKERAKNPFRTTLTSNILIHKNIFNTTKFNEQITEYGYEDLVFTEELKKKHLSINHINNPCYHLNYETSDIFLSKTKIALENLVNLENKGIIKNDVTNLQLTYLKLRKFHLKSPLLLIFKVFSDLLILNLKSKKPILFFMDLLKIGIYTKLKNHKE